MVGTHSQTINTHAQTHTNTQTHKRTDTHTHTHTHVQIQTVTGTPSNQTNRHIQEMNQNYLCSCPGNCCFRRISIKLYALFVNVDHASD